MHDEWYKPSHSCLTRHVTMFIQLVIVLITLIVVYFYYYYKKVHYYFDQRGIKYLPGVPVFGNLLKCSLNQRHMMEDLRDVYDAFPGERYVGLIESLRPVYLLRDPELIKTITVKDSEHFSGRKLLLKPDVDYLPANSLFLLKGSKWRSMRAVLSPAFTGSKLKLTMPFIQAVNDNLIAYLTDYVNKEVDVSDVMRRYANDVIATAAFGIKYNSFQERNNQLLATGMRMTAFDAWQKFSIVLDELFPTLKQALKIRYLPEEITRLFQKLALDTVQHRINNNLERPDIVQVVINAYKDKLDEDNDKLKDFTKDQLLAQLFGLYLASFEAISGTLSAAVHELALHPDIQEKLYQEIKEFKERNGKITHQNISELKYMECVINETLRKWTPAWHVNRECTKPYVLPPPREGAKPCPVNVGDLFYFPLNTLLLNPEFFPNPEVFDPERFSDENKHKLVPDTFIPFGSGPRSCIGMRISYLEMKMIIFDLLLNFKFVKTKKTADPIVVDKSNFLVKVNGGTWAMLEARK